MMKNHLFFGALCVAAALISSQVLAQDGQISKPNDGEMVALDATKLWKMSQMDDANLSNIQQIATGLKFPSISPDGNRVVLFDPAKADAPKRLTQWQIDTPEMKEISRADEASIYVTWDDAENISVRQSDKPFFHDAVFSKYRLSGKKPVLRSKKPLVESKYVVYDNEDVIILVRKEDKTLQAISDMNADRYYAPMLSPDEKFVVFSGLTTGVHIFDIAKNATVYIGSHGTDPQFSQDGRYLIYAKTTDDGEVFTGGDLILVDLQEHSQRVIANPSKEIRLRGSLSRNAEFIAYETADGKVFRAALPRKIEKVLPIVKK